MIENKKQIDELAAKILADTEGANKTTTIDDFDHRLFEVFVRGANGLPRNPFYRSQRSARALASSRRQELALLVTEFLEVNRHNGRQGFACALNFMLQLASTLPSRDDILPVLDRLRELRDALLTLEDGFVHPEFVPPPRKAGRPRLAPLQREFQLRCVFAAETRAELRRIAGADKKVVLNAAYRDVANHAKEAARIVLERGFTRIFGASTIRRWHQDLGQSHDETSLEYAYSASYEYERDYGDLAVSADLLWQSLRIENIGLTLIELARRTSKYRE